MCAQFAIPVVYGSILERTHPLLALVARSGFPSCRRLRVPMPLHDSLFCQLAEVFLRVRLHDAPTCRGAFKREQDHNSARALQRSSECHGNAEAIYRPER